MYGLKVFATLFNFWIRSFRIVLGWVADIEDFKTSQKSELYLSIIVVLITTFGLIALATENMGWPIWLIVALSAVGFTIKIISVVDEYEPKETNNDGKDWSEWIHEKKLEAKEKRRKRSRGDKE